MYKTKLGGLALAVVCAVLVLSGSADAATPWPKTLDSTIAAAKNLWQGDKFGSQEKPNYATDHIIVKMQDGTLQKITVPETDNINDVLSTWQNKTGVEYAELDGLAWALGQETSWGFDTVKAETAYTTNGATGSGVIVAVVDTGVDYNHEDLTNNIWANSDEIAGNSLDDDSNGYIDDTKGYDFIGDIYTATQPDNDPDDDYGHGTHVSGIIAAENNTVGVRGIAPSAKIMPVKVLDASGYGWNSDIAAGIRYAADNGADIINLSLGGSSPSRTLEAAIDYAYAQGVLVIAAAGNSNSYSSPSYPAVYNHVVSVAASDEDGNIAYFSNWGKVDVIAPGDLILSSVPGNKYAKYSGTSMAAPHAAGVAALIMQKHTINNVNALRHALEATANDFGMITGADYTSGQGMVDALSGTGNFTAKAIIYADKGWVKTDGSDKITITVSVRDASNAALASNSVAWSTDKGTISSATSTTNGSGLASITFTADDASGLANITATPTGATAASLQIALGNDLPQPKSIGITKITSENTEYFLDGEDEYIDEVTTTSDTLSNNIFTPGDEISIWAYAFAGDRETHEVNMTYAVLDPEGNIVEDLSGITENVTFGEDYSGWFYIPEGRLTTKPLILPSDIADGKYTLSVLLTDIDSSETATRSAHFWVNEQPEVLLVYNNYCSETPVESLDFGGVTICGEVGHALAEEVEALGYDVMLWDTNDMGSPTSSDLSLFPVVIWRDSGLMAADSATLQTYLDNGGNLLLASPLISGYNITRYTPTDFSWDYLHSRYIQDIIMPDAISGTSSGMFSGLNFDTNYYNLNGNGTHTNYYTQEIELNTADDATAILAFEAGNTAAKTAGVQVATDNYRLIFTSFPFDAINDASTGNATKSFFLSNSLTWLFGSPSYTSVSPHKFANNKERTITITGENFYKTGVTTVKLDSYELSNVTVNSRTEITATIPAGLTKGKYKLKIMNPDGNTISKNDAVTITKGGALIESVAPTFVANHKQQDIVITGYKFTNDTKVYLGKTLLTEVQFDNANQLTVTIPANLDPKRYNIKVKNKDTAADTLKNGLKIRYGYTSILMNGDNNLAVKYLEQRLKNYGYNLKQPNELFDDKTTEVLLRFQKDQGLAQTGILDTLTRYTLNNIE